MYDIHCHILPDVDDGAQDEAVSFAMIQKAYETGTRHIVLTPHLNHPLKFKGSDDLERDFKAFQEKVKARYSDLHLYLGAENYISRRAFRKSMDIALRPIEGTEYILIEFARNILLSEIKDAVHELQLRGFKPIIAHVEEYHALREGWTYIEELREDGAYIQCNKKYLLDRKFAERHKFVKTLIEKGLVDFVASDGHNITTRPMGLDGAYQWIKRNLSVAEADRVLVDNQRKMLANESISREAFGGHQFVKRKTVRRYGTYAAMLIPIILVIWGATVYAQQLENRSAEIAKVKETKPVVAETTVVTETTTIQVDSKVQETALSPSEPVPAETVKGNTAGEVAEASEVVETTMPEKSTAVPESASNTHEEELVQGYVGYLQELEGYYMSVVNGYYSQLKAAVSIEDETVQKATVDGIIAQVQDAEINSDNKVYKTLYDMQNDLEDYDYDVAIVQTLRDHYLNVKVETSNQYRAELEAYYNKNK